MYYDKELRAIRKSGRYRERILYSEDLVDFASNDYLGFSKKEEILKKALQRVLKEKIHSPRASMLVNGYHKIHAEFEEYLSSINRFEACMVVGSGFMANMALLETLPRKKDIILLDSEYHASGVLAAKKSDAKVIFFRHNDVAHLEEILKNEEYNRAIVGVEGIYSMSGDLVKKEIFDICDRFEALLIVDEAHSVGVVGENLLGVYDLYEIEPKENHIKMGTLGKAMGSYGAYILSSLHVREFLINRAKSVIYTTAPSLIECAVAKESFSSLLANKADIKREIKIREEIVKEEFGVELDGLIFPFKVDSNGDVLKLRDILLTEGYLVGAIRAPTVEFPILRIIPNLGESSIAFRNFSTVLKEIS